MHSTFWRVTVVLLCSCTFAAPQVKQATYPDTSDGLQFQAQTVLNAYLSGDQREFEASTRLFALPDPETWLGHTFGPEHAADLAADYRKYFKSFQSALARQLERWRETDEVAVRVSPLQKLPSRDRVMPRPDAPTPQEPVTIERFQFTLHAKGQRASSQWVDSFVYRDGAFRFIGPGAFPFWDHPLVVRLNASSSGGGQR